MKRTVFARFIVLVLFMIYPFIVYFGIKVLPPSFFGLLLVGILAIRFGVLLPDERKILLPMLLGLLVYAISTVVLDSASMLLFYPVLVNFILCTVFANSLRHEESILLRIVLARGVAISEYTPRYLYRLTAIWACFFVVNGIISLWTVTLTMEAWILYNGLISYFIIAILFGGELLFRRRYIKQMSITNP